MLVKFNANASIGHKEFIQDRVYDISEKEYQQVKSCCDLPNPKDPDQKRKWEREKIPAKNMREYVNRMMDLTKDKVHTKSIA